MAKPRKPSPAQAAMSPEDAEIARLRDGIRIYARALREANAWTGEHRKLYKALIHPFGPEENA